MSLTAPSRIVTILGTGDTGETEPDVSTPPPAESLPFSFLATSCDLWIFVVVMDVSEHYLFDPEEYPLLIPAPGRTRSLGIQPPLLALKRAVPIRWDCHLAEGEGDWSEFVGHQQVLWDGKWEYQQPMQCNDRDPSSDAPHRRWSVSSNHLLELHFTLELRLYPDPERFVVFSTAIEFTGRWPTIVFLGPEVVGANWVHGLFGDVTLTPQYFFQDLR